MNINFIIRIALLIVGILLNVFIGKICMLVFRKDNTFTRIPVRFAGIFCLINSLLPLLNIHL